MVMLTDTGPKVYVDTMKNFICDSYDYLEYTLNHFNSIKINIYLGGNYVDHCAEILVDAELFESVRSSLSQATRIYCSNL